MGIGFMTDISMKQTKKYLDDDGTEVKPKTFLQRVMRYKSGCDQIQKMRDRYRKTGRDNFGRKKISPGYLSYWVKIM